jgi:tRNA(fMet)-specific endonuclease VapC
MARVAGRTAAAKVKGEGMMIYILDTDLFSLSLLPDSPEYKRMEARAAQLLPEDKVVTTVVTYEEQTRGWLAYAAKSQELQHQVNAYERLKRHLLNYLQWEVLDFDWPAANEFARLRGKVRIGTLDLKIAAIALSRSAVVVSRNLKDFRKVPELRVEDWSQA